MSPRSNTKKIELIKHWSQWFHDHSSSFESRVGSQLAYLYAAIAKDTYVELKKHSALVRVLRDNDIQKTDDIWGYIKVV